MHTGKVIFGSLSNAVPDHRLRRVRHASLALRMLRLGAVTWVLNARRSTLGPALAGVVVLSALLTLCERALEIPIANALDWVWLKNRADSSQVIAALIHVFCYGLMIYWARRALRRQEPLAAASGRSHGMLATLSTVSGVVQQSGRHAAIQSSAGNGPGETVLLVDDEVPVRRLVRKLLERQGYSVLEATSSIQALELCKHHPAVIHLLLTDMMMPELNGPELARRAAPLRPSMKVLYMSGYADDAALGGDVLGPETTLLQKPFTAIALDEGVRDALAGE